MATSDRDGELVIKRVSAPKPHDVLADQLRTAILDGSLSEGRTLPPERELVEQTGLTRGSVREALRVLAVEGLIDTRPGRFGGNVVKLPGLENLATGIGQFIRGRRISIGILQETRYTLEPELARLAALRRTDDDVVRLQEVHARLVAAAGAFTQFSIANVQWHNAVARASGNELLAALLHALSYGVAVSTTTEEYDTLETRNLVIRVHEQITAAIIARDPARAERRMRQHIGATNSQSAKPATADVSLSDTDS